MPSIIFLFIISSILSSPLPIYSNGDLSFVQSMHEYNSVLAQGDWRSGARQLPYDQYGASPHGEDPHGRDPHGYPEDEYHDKNLPANQNELRNIAPDPYGGQVQPPSRSF